MIDCPFCQAESWYGKDHMSACPVVQLERLQEKVVRYRRFVQGLSRLFVDKVRPHVNEFFARERRR